MPRPVPLNSSKMAGTGFVVVDSKRGWLLTTVHMFSEQDDTPLNTTAFDGESLRVVGENIDLALEDLNGPRYNLVPHRPSKTYMDVIALRLDASELAELLSRFGGYSLSTLGVANLGDEVEFYGYPGLGTTLSPLETRGGKIVQTTGLNLELSVPSELGFSGGPLLKGKELIGIVNGDTGKHPDMVGAIAITFFATGRLLFR
jgi:hypothetical protein